MKKNLLIGGAVVAAFVASSVQAQTYVHWSAPVSPAQATRMAYFPMGTQLDLLTRTQVSSKDNKPGDRVYLDVAEGLSYQGQVIIPAGSVAVGEVTSLQHNGHVGKKGKIGIRLLYVQTPYGPVHLTGRASDEGTSGTIPSVATMLFVSALGGFFIHGTSARIPEGTPVQAMLAEDLRFFVQPPQQQAVVQQVMPDDAALASMTVPAPTDPNTLPANFDPSAFGGNQVQTASTK
ncbi:MAG: hypothetical protein ACTHMG_16020 [Sphingomonas sp.]